jgi:hypothetical protein
MVSTVGLAGVPEFTGVETGTGGVYIYALSFFLLCISIMPGLNSVNSG